MTVRFIVGEALSELRKMDAGSADCLITSPPYLNLRAYLPDDDPNKGQEIGTEDSPGDFLEALLTLMDECWRVLADHATFWIVLGDTHAGSGGAGGDYQVGGMREGQAKFNGSASKARNSRYNQPDGPSRSGTRTKATREGWPREQSVCWVPDLFGASLAYGRNLLTGAEHQQWITRPPVTWCKPSPPVGELTRKFRTATELIIYGGKQPDHFFDLDAVRGTPRPNQRGQFERLASASRGISGGDSGNPEKERRSHNPMGAPPFNYWIVSNDGYAGAHFATYPLDLLVKPIRAGCPEKVCLDCGKPVARVTESRYVNDEQDDSTRKKPTGRLTSVDHPPERGWERERERETVGWDCGCPAHGAQTRPGLILDCFGGSGTTGLAAAGHGRDAILIDLDARNLDQARDRLGFFLDH